MKNQDNDGISTLFFRNRYLLVMTVLVILVSGIFSVVKLPRLEDPRIANRYPLIITPVPGASAARVESQVTEIIEESLQEIAAIKDIESTSRSGVSIILLELDGKVDASTNQPVFSEIRDKVGSIRHRLPADAVDPVIDDKRDPAGFTQIVALNWITPDPVPLGILDRAAQDLSDRLRNIPGTELVRLYGTPEEEITLTVDPAELVDLGITVETIAELVAAADSKTTAGVLRSSGSDTLIEVQGELNSLERIAAIPLPVASAYSVLRIGDIATIERGWRRPASEIALVDQKRSILIAARMDDSRRIDHWARDVDRTIAEFAKRTGQSVQVESIFQQERYTSRQLSELTTNLFAGAAVVVAVVFFIMGWRLALIVGFALPLVVSLVLLGLQSSHGAIHQMSIYGIIIALGLLIDNAIVVADEISRNKSAGLSPLDAVDKAVRHLFLPLLASTLTTVLAFAPILLLPGNVGDFVRSIGTSVILALIASFLVGLTIIAGLAGIFAAPTPSSAKRVFWRDGITSSRVNRLYQKMLRITVRRPAIAMLAAIVLPVTGFITAATMGNEFFPPVDRDMFTVQVWLQSDSSIDNTQRQALAIDNEIHSFENIERSFWMVGNSFPTVYYNLIMNKDKLSYYAQSIVVANSDQAAKEIIPQLQGRLDRKFPQAQIVVSQFGQGPPVVADIEYRIFGPDLTVLQNLGDQLRLLLQNHAAVLHTQTTMPRGQPKLWFEADEDDSRIAGISTGGLAKRLQTSLEGVTGGSVIENLESLPVRIRFPDAYRSDLNLLASIPIAHEQEAGWIPLSAIGNFRLRPELGGITRYNTERSNIVKAYTRNGALPIEVAHDVFDQFELSGTPLPDGYRIEFGGAIEQDREAMADLTTYLPMLLVLTVATLILTFKSAKLAALLGLVAALSVGPGLLATWAADLPISFNTILGTLGLVGLAFNNSIVVLASILARPDAKTGEPEAVARQVGVTTRHLISTTLTTIGGFLPLILIVGGDFWPSLAIVLAGGVIGSLILAVVFVPAVYMLLQGHTQRSKGKPAKFAGFKIQYSALHSLLASTLALFFVTGCAVGPDYHEPQIELPTGYTKATSESALTSTNNSKPISNWWRTLKDPLLSKLIEDAVTRNYDIRFALAELRATRFMRHAVKANLYPKIGSGGTFQRRRASENGPINLATLSQAGLAKVESNLFDIGFDASWELDLFGGIQRSIEAADADLAASVDSHRDVLVSVIAEVARNYVELRGNQQRLQVAEDNAAIQSATLELVRNKLTAGIAAEIDRSRASGQLATTQSRIPPIKAEIRAAIYRLSVLTGRQPTALLATLSESKALPNAPSTIPIGLPSELLRRRPDVRRAEQRLVAASARIGQATADLYPRFFLVGLAGLQSISASDLFTGPSRAWSIGPTIRWPVFQGGRIRANIKASEAKFDSAYAQFRQSILLAVEDVESTLVRLAEHQNQLQRLKTAERQSRRSMELAQILYDKGLKDFLTVLDAERVLTQVRDQVVQSETGVLLQLIQLYKSLGGGWQVFEKNGPEGHPRPTNANNAMNKLSAIGRQRPEGVERLPTHLNAAA